MHGQPWVQTARGEQQGVGCTPAGDERPLTVPCIDICCYNIPAKAEATGGRRMARSR